MPSDLIVSKILLPATVTAPCPNKIDVEITNIGTDDAELPFDVLLEILNVERFPPISIRRVVRGLEGDRLAPNQTVTVNFLVIFPCQTQASLRVTADASNQVLNNARTNPQKLIIVTPIDLLPWVEVDSPQLSIIDQHNNVTRNPSAICPNAEVVVEVTVRNRGCVGTPAFNSQLYVDHSQGTLVRSLLVPPIPAGGSVISQSVISGPWPPGLITFRYIALTGLVIPNQCPGAILQSTITSLVATGSSPVAQMQIHGPIFPGQAPTISWGVHNDCSDLDTIQAQVFFGTTMVFQSTPKRIGFRTTVGGGPDTTTIPPAIASTFWLFGTQTLQLRIVVTGNDPGPQPVNATVQVVPEMPTPISFAWANLTFAPWKAAYRVAGAFSNASTFSAMTITTASVMETEPTIPISLPVLLMPSLLTTLAIAGMTPSTGALGVTLRIQTWDWMNAVNAITGPTTVTITYTMSFSFTDGFGNSYPGPFSATSTMTVAVSMSKRLMGFASAALMVTAAAWAALALAFTIVALATPYPADLVPTIVAGFCAVVATAALGLSIWYRAKAYDPPLPDFDYKERVPFHLPEVLPIQSEVADDPLIRSLHAISHLLQRIHRADQVMTAIERKIIGAKTDQNEEIVQIHRVDYRKAYSILTTSSELLSDAIAEFEHAFHASRLVSEEDILRRLKEIRDHGLTDTARHVWAKAELPEKALDSIAEAIRKFEKLPESFIETLRQAAAALALSIDDSRSRFDELMSDT